MKKEELLNVFMILENTLFVNYSDSEIRQAFRDLNDYGLQLISGPRRLTGGSKAKILLIMSFLLALIFYVYLHLYGADIFEQQQLIIKNQNCLSAIEAKNLQSYPMGFIIKDAQAHVKAGTGLKIYKNIAESCSHHKLYELPQPIKNLQYAIYGLRALTAFLGISGSTILATLLSNLNEYFKHDPLSTALPIAAQHDVAHAVESALATKSKKSPRRSVSRGRRTPGRALLLNGGSKNVRIPDWMYQFSGVGGMRGGGGDVGKYFPVVPIKNASLSAHIITLAIIVATCWSILLIYKKFEWYDAGTYHTIEIPGPEPTQMAMARTSGLSAYPSAYPSPEPRYQNVRERLTTEELLMLNSTKIRATWQAILEYWFPSMRTLVSPSILDILTHSFAVIGETAYFSYLINLCAKALSSDVGRGLLGGIGFGIAQLLLKFAQNPELGKKLFMDMIGLVVIMVQLAMTPYTSGVRYIENRISGTEATEINDQEVLEKVMDAGAVVAALPPENIPAIVESVVSQSRAKVPDEQIAQQIVTSLQAQFNLQNNIEEPLDILILRQAEAIKEREIAKYELRKLTLSV
jgi:hypothetical protein